MALVAEARRILGHAFTGAYLQGSFALGAADLASDCDFLVVTARPVTDHEFAELALLHEHGITLAGPPARDVVDPVPGEVLRARMRAELPGLLAALESWISWDVAWCQRYAVTTYCRVLATLATGRVLSKPDALRWAGGTLDRRWRPLIEQTRADRAAFDPDEAPRPGSVEETRAFAAYCVERGAPVGG